MKLLKKLLVRSFLGSCGLLSLGYVNAYDLTSQDNKALDLVEEKLIEIVEKNDALDLYDVIDLLENKFTKRNLSERQHVILHILIEDLRRYAEGGVYEELLPEDCYEDEYYDAEDKWCYLIEDSQGGDEDENLMNSEIHFSEEETDIQPTSLYSFKQGVMSHESGQQKQSYEQYAQGFIDLFPKRYLDAISLIGFYDDENSDTGAYVERIENDPNHWRVVFNMGGADEGDSWLFVHEMAHIVTLESGQMSNVSQDTISDATRSRHEEKCKTNYVYEGCLKESAYLDDFIEQFRPEEEREAIENEQDVYMGAETNFVTDYAATNPGEDIAESFAYFVLTPKNTKNNDSISQKKINFFYAYPELVKLRSFIRSNIE